LKVLITGGSGQLGRELQLACPPDIEMVPCDIEELDITNPERVTARVGEVRPRVVINAAAYTAVDRAEQERERVFAVNATGAGNVARAAQAIDARVIQISTDFVFGGEANRPYSPDTETGPLGVYGASKLAGEQEVLEATEGTALAIRTAWVYSRFGHNFVKTMLRLMEQRSQLTVVTDQIGSPTWARSLAKVVWKACTHHDLFGRYHWTDAGVASWYDFAIAIQEEARSTGLLENDCQVEPISTADFPTVARRPRFSVLDTSAIRRDLDIAATHWRRQLRSMLQDMRDYGED